MTQDEAAKPEPSKDEPEKQAPAAGGEPAQRVAEDNPTNWVLRIVLVLVALVAAFIALRMSAAFFPRWWAQQVKSQVVDGSFSSSILWGLAYGFVFTFIPLLILVQIRRRFFNWTWRIVVAVVALLLAAPNWLTLGIVLGTNDAAVAGDHILDDHAPWFRGGTLIGACIAAVAVIALTTSSLLMARRKNQVKRLKNERDQLRRSVAQADDQTE